MYGQAHAGLGWAIGVLAPGSDRRLRLWCLGAALLPDIDALPMAFGAVTWHHTFGHNVFLGALCVAVAVWHHRDRSRARGALSALLVGLCFGSHLLGDMTLSGWGVRLFWPVSAAEYEFVPNYGLDHPVNFALACGLMGLALILPFYRAATPLELLSARLDLVVLNFFRRRSLACRVCGRPCNNRCDACRGPVCLKHGKVDWRFRISCPACAEGCRADAP